MSNCWLKKMHYIRELQVKFPLGQNEDCSLGESISDGSEKLLQRGKGKVSVTHDVSEGVTCSQGHTLAKT